MESFGPLYSSQHRITHNGVVLLDYGGLLLGDYAPQLTPGRLMQVVQPVGGAYIETIDRGNRSHTLSFTLVRRHATVWLAMMDEFNFIKNLPAGRADTTIEVKYASAGQTLKFSTISAAPVKLQGVRFSVFEISILGGELQGDDMRIAGVLDDDGGEVTDDNGGQIIAG